ncbi:MAG: DUF3800 domain-containing protein [Candidatus Nitrosotenuis sp.]
MPHINIFVDESGNLGFTNNSTKIFVVSYVIVINSLPNVIETKIKRLQKSINTHSKPRKKINEFKFSKDSHETKQRFLRLIKTFNVKTGIVVIYKDSVKSTLKSDPCYLYNYLAVNYVISNVVNNHLVRIDPYNRIIYTIDRSMSSKAQRGFNDYCEQKIDYLKNQIDRNMNVSLKIDHANSVLNPALQIADYIAGATYAKYEYGNSQYYDEIKNILTYKDKWDWKNRINW